MPSPSGLLFTKDHEWVKIEGDAATVGITDYAQSSLGDIVYVEMPKPGSAVQQSQAMGVVESVKAVSDVYAPLSGTVSQVNGRVEDDPAKVNADPYGEGWLVKMRMSDPGQSKSLLDSAAYDDLLQAQGR